MTPGADVVVVGAGIIGSSIAYQLARRGTGVMVLDKALAPAEGATGASSSICRCRYTHPELVGLAHLGREAFGNWADFTGLAEPRSSLHRVGVLWMLGQTMVEATAEAEALMGQDVETEVLDPGALVERFPALSPCAQPLDFTGETDHECHPGEAFLFEPRSGYVDPVAATEDLIEATRLHGGEVRFNARVVGLDKTGARVTGLKLADGTTVASDLVINASGPWCNQLNELAGVKLDWTLTPTRIQTVYRPWPEDLGSLPIGLDPTTGVYFRPELGGRQMLIGSVIAEDEEEIVDDPDDFKLTPDAEFTQMKLAAFHHRVPGLAPRGELTGIAGLYTINREDVHPVLGPTGVDGFWVANGFSGHGFKLAPGIGSMIAQSLTGERLDGFDTDLPMSFFGVDRRPIDVAVKSVLA